MLYTEPESSVPSESVTVSAVPGDISPASMSTAMRPSSERSMSAEFSYIASVTLSPLSTNTAFTRPGAGAYIAEDTASERLDSIALSRAVISSFRSEMAESTELLSTVASRSPAST